MAATKKKPSVKKCPICKREPATFSTRGIPALSHKYTKVCRRCAGNAV